jgi:acetylornithine aminotransferase
VQNTPKNPALAAVRKNLMVELDERRRALTQAGKRLFDFGLGDPKEPTPPFLQALRAPPSRGVAVPERSAPGAPPRRGGTRAPLRGDDPEAQVLACAGAKEAIFHLPLAFAGVRRAARWSCPTPATRPTRSARASPGSSR